MERRVHPNPGRASRGSSAEGHAMPPDGTLRAGAAEAAIGTQHVVTRRQEGGACSWHADIWNMPG